MSHCTIISNILNLRTSFFINRIRIRMSVFCSLDVTDVCVVDRRKKRVLVLVKMTILLQYFFLTAPKLVTVLISLGNCFKFSRYYSLTNRNCQPLVYVRPSSQNNGIPADLPAPSLCSSMVSVPLKTCGADNHIAFKVQYIHLAIMRPN